MPLTALRLIEGVARYDMNSLSCFPFCHDVSARLASESRSDDSAAVHTSSTFRIKFRVSA